MKKNNNTPDSTTFFTVKTECILSDFLVQCFPQNSRSSIKKMMEQGRFYVNNESITKYNTPLQAGDRVTMKKAVIKTEMSHPALSLVYEDDDIIVVNKKSGLLTVATEKGEEETVYRILRSYIKEMDPAHKIFIVHRIDKETSGLLLFAKSEDVKLKLQANWDKGVQERQYVAVVEGNMSKKKGTIKLRLLEQKNLLVKVVDEPNGLESITHYTVLQSNNQYSMLSLQLETGRKHQIRAHLSAIGHPVVGDRKYGAKPSPIKRMALHAQTLVFQHPTQDKIMRFKSDMPKKFYALFE